jgi:hypothetical protein
VTIWDHKVKKRLRQYPRYGSPVAALALSADGAHLAVGASYTWDAGEEGACTAERPALFVRELGEEVKVRPFGWLGAVSCAGSKILFSCSQRDGVLAELVESRLVSSDLATA